MKRDHWSVTQRLAGLASFVAIVVTLSACSSSGSKTPSSSGPGDASATSASGTVLEVGKLPFDIKKYCGTKPFSAGEIDGYGGNPWRIEVKTMIENLAKQCPNNTGFKYFDAAGNLQQYNSTISSWATEGVKIIGTYDDFGVSAVPTFRSAQRSGALIVTNNGQLGDANVPNDVTAVVLPSFDDAAKAWVDFLTKATDNKGKVVLIGGPPGNLTDPPAIAGIKKAIAASGSGIQLVEDKPQFASWTPAMTQQVMSSLLASHPDIDGVVLTYMAMAPAVIRAYQAAHLPLPAIAGQTSSNEVVCDTAAWKKASETFQAFSLDASGNQAALAFAKGLAKFEGIHAPELGPTDAYTTSNYVPYIDTLNGKMPSCESTLPPGADLSMALTSAQVAAALK